MKMIKRKMVISLLIVSCTAHAEVVKLQSATTQQPTKSLTATAPTVEQLLQQATAALVAKQTQQAITAYQQAVKQRSGMAASWLGNYFAKHDGQKAVKMDQDAVAWGYPQQGYLALSKLYQTGAPNLSASHTLSVCYANLAAPENDVTYIQHCQASFPLRFKVVKEKGMQNAYEAKLQARRLQHRLCQREPIALLDDRFNATERLALEEVFCQAPNKSKQALALGTLVLEDHQLYEVDKGGKVAYQAPLLIGTLVTQVNAPSTLLVFDGKQLVPVKEGMRLVQKGHTTEFRHGQFVPIN